MLLLPGTAAAVARLVDTVVPEAQEGTNIPITPGIDIATITTITTVRSAVRHELLPATTDGPISPTSTDYSYLSLINHKYLKSITTVTSNPVDILDS